MNRYKLILLLAAAALLLSSTVEGTIAYISSGTGPMENVFAPAEVVPVIQETISADQTTGSSVYVWNNGNVDAYIRAAVVVNWKHNTGEYLKPIADTDYAISFKQNSGWVKGATDNFYYYTGPIKPSESVPAQAGTAYATDCLLTGYQLSDGIIPPAGYTLHVEILAQAIQTAPAEALDAANWAWRPAASGNSSGDESAARGDN